MVQAATMAADTGDAMILENNLPFSTDGGIAARAAIGVIVLATDQTLEHELRLMMNLPGVAFFESRIWNDAAITPETLKAMEDRIEEATRLILPGLDLNVVAFGCTSASMVIGEEAVFDRIRRVRPGIACTTPITAAFAAFRAMGARRIGVITPYRDDVNRVVADYITKRGLEVPIFGSFNEEDDRTVARITTASLKNAVKRAVERARCDAVFVSCTSLRLAECAAEIEHETGLPVTSSNHAMAWHALRLAGIADNQPRFGRLFTLPLADG